MTDTSARVAYDRYWEEGIDGWQPQTTAISTGMADLLRSVCTGRDVLDYGCGDGSRYGHIIRDVAKSYFPADVSQSVVDKRRAAGDSAVQIDSLADADFAVDTLVSIEVLEHVLDPLAALKVATSKVRPGGTVVLTVPNAFNAWNRIRMASGRLPASGIGGPGVRRRTWIAPHIRFFDWDSLVSLAKESGVEAQKGYADGLDIWKLRPMVSGRLRKLRPGNQHPLTDIMVLVGRKS